MKKIKIPSTIRGRLILSFSLGAIIIFSLLTLFLSLFIKNVLEQQIDHHIHIVANLAKQIVENYQDKNRDNLLAQLVSSEGMTINVISSDGTVLLQTNSPDIAKATQPELERLLTNPTSSPNTQNFHFTLGSLRFMTTQITINNVNGILAVGYSVKTLEDSFRNLLILLIFSMIISLLLILLGIKRLIDKSLFPLEKIAQKAQSVTPNNLSVMFLQRNQTEEIAKVSKALNTMAQKLKQVFLTEHEFFSNTAHTIKTPLAVVRSIVEAFTTVPVSDKKTILTSLDKVSDNITDLLLLSRLQTNKEHYHTNISLSNCLEELVTIAKVLASEKLISLNSDIKPNIYIKGNEALIKRALANLVQNAINYTSNKGIINISLHSYYLNETQHQIEIIISDTGIGINKKDQKHIFERFYRGSNVLSNTGNGLGLAITKATIEQMNGEIHIFSKLNKGTTIKITLPHLIVV